LVVRLVTQCSKMLEVPIMKKGEAFIKRRRQSRHKATNESLTIHSYYQPSANEPRVDRLLRSFV
jgi:hypothetical protein